MPEYLAPGVFVEETSFRSKSIEGVSTTTTGFIGPTRYGPVDLDNEIITSLLDFERTYGSRRQLDYDGSIRHNYTWHAVRAFFEEGGKRLYVSRVFLPTSESDDGKARGELGPAAGHSFSFSLPRVGFRARYPGAAGNARVQLTLAAGQNVLSTRKVTEKDPSGASIDREVVTVAGLQDRDVVLFTTLPAATEWAGAEGPYFLARRQPDGRWTFTEHPAASGEAYPLEKITSADCTGGRLQIRPISVDVTVLPADDYVPPSAWTRLALDPAHQRDGAPDSLRARFGENAKQPSRNREIPVVIEDEAEDGLALLRALLEAGKATRPDFELQLQAAGSPADRRTVTVTLEDGNDGLRPTSAEYEGEEVGLVKKGLKQFEDLEDISIVAAPGVTFKGEGGEIDPDADAVTRLLIGHCERMRYRIAVLDSGNRMTISDVRKMRGTLDSTHAALYYPWVVVTDPLTRQQISLPPSGFVAGIYARNDVKRAVYKAPANEVVTLAQGFEAMLNRSQQEVLNPEGINAFRFFEGRGFRLWGARTISSDPEWKYVNIRRYFAYLERSIDKGTQWAVFEPNGEALWANVRRSIDDFLLNEWQSGALLGDKPDKAFFVRCDRSTMTQNDLDNGRLICLVGVAALKPAEFVIIRIGQWTADRK